MWRFFTLEKNADSPHLEGALKATHPAWSERVKDSKKVRGCGIVK
jgi:hypothetical protein